MTSRLTAHIHDVCIYDTLYITHIYHYDVYALLVTTVDSFFYTDTKKQESEHANSVILAAALRIMQSQRIVAYSYLKYSRP